jgi:hypothetical protein
MRWLISFVTRLSSTVADRKHHAALAARGRDALQKLELLLCRGRDWYFFRVARIFLLRVDARRRRAIDAISAPVLRRGDYAWPGWTSSLCLHLLFFAGLLAAWTIKPHIAPDRSTAVVPIDLVMVALETNVAAAAKPAPLKTDFAQTSPLAVQIPNVQIASLPEADSTAQTATDPDAAAQNEEGEIPHSTRQEAQPVQTRRDSASSRLIPDSAPQAASSSSAPRDALPSQRLVQAEGRGDASTASLMAILNSQIVACWSPPPTAPRLEQFAVEFELRLNSNGTIAVPPRLTGASAEAAPHDASVRAAADAARRALYSCAPYRLPGSLYDQWREIASFRFDPASAMGRPTTAR